MADIYEWATIFYDEDDNRLGSYPGILPAHLRIGMKMTIEGREGTWEVVDWNFNVGKDEHDDAGLRIILR